MKLIIGTPQAEALMAEAVAAVAVYIQRLIRIDDLLQLIHKLRNSHGILERAALREAEIRKAVRDFVDHYGETGRTMLWIMTDMTDPKQDVVARDAVLDLLRAYMEEDADRSILISSHISGDLEGLCDDLYMIHEGKMLLHEDTDVLLGSYGIIKADENQYRQLDKEYLLRAKHTGFGWECLTAHRDFYMENYPNLVVEKGTIDGVITLMTGGTDAPCGDAFKAMGPEREEV